MENLEILKNLFLFNGMKEKQIEAALNKLESEEKKYRKKLPSWKSVFSSL